MALSSDILSEFAKITNDTSKESTESIVYGKVRIDNGKIYVIFDGSNTPTPVNTTVNVADGERVMVTIKNHTATVIGNVTSPSARTDEVRDVADQITDFEIVMSDKVTTQDLEAVNAIIGSLRAKLGVFEGIEAIHATISELEAKYAEIEYIDAKTIKAIEADIEKLTADFANIDNITTDNLEALNADINNLKAYNADFTYVSADRMEVLKANIKELEVKKLSAEEADIKYANIDFSNIGKAAMEYFYAKSGLIDNVTVGDATITGELVGVTIKGSLIEGGTVVADKLVIKGEDGLYYKLNSTIEGLTQEQLSTEEYQSGLHGDNIIAHTITATKIDVDDLVAFDATIGGFNITDSSIYSGVKESINNTTRGIYLDNTGQVAFGDGNNYLKYYKDVDGKWKLEVSASSITFGASNKNVEDAIVDVQKDVDKLRDEITTLLRIESSRGTVFKNDTVATVLSVVIYHGTQRITNSTDMKAVFGETAYLQWYWQRLDDDDYGIMSAGDSRFGDNGFTFTLSPEDVDTKVTFMCELIT